MKIIPKYLITSNCCYLIVGQRVLGTIVKLNGKINEITLHVSAVNQLKKAFLLTDDQVQSFLNTLIDKTIQEHIAEENSKVLSESESKELEDDLRGLGYL